MTLRNRIIVYLRDTEILAGLGLEKKSLGLSVRVFSVI